MGATGSRLSRLSDCDAVFHTVADQHRHGDLSERIFVGRGPAQEMAADLRRHDHVIGEHGLKLVRGRVWAVHCVRNDCVFSIFSARLSDAIFNTAGVAGPRVSRSTLVNAPTKLIPAIFLSPYSIRYSATIRPP